MSGSLEVEERNGAVVVTIDNHYAILPPDQAREVSECIAKYAYYAKTGLQPKTKSMIAEQIKTKMVTRTALVLKNLLDRNKTPQYIANELVNIILSEAL